MAQVPNALFAAAVLAQLGKPVTAENITKMTAWWHWESGGGNAAAFNPADIIMGATPKKPDPAGTTPFNSFGNGLHVANYPDLASGVLQTANYIQNQPSLLKAFNKDVSYQDGLSQITGFMSGWAAPAFMQNIQNTPQATAVSYGSAPINHGADIPDTIVNQITADIGGATEIPLTAIFQGDPTNPFGGLDPTALPNPTNGAIDAAIDPLAAVSSPLDFLKTLLKAVTTGAFWKRILYVGAGLVLIFMGLAILAGKLQSSGDLPKAPMPVPV